MKRYEVREVATSRLTVYRPGQIIDERDIPPDQAERWLKRGWLRPFGEPPATEKPEKPAGKRKSILGRGRRKAVTDE